MFTHPEVCEEAFTLGLTLRPDLGKLLLIPFFNYCLTFEGLADTRSILEEEYISSASLEFFKEFLAAELSAPLPDAVAIRNCFEVALRYYGATEESKFIW